MSPRIYRKLAVLTEGSTDIHRNKTAMGLLRFRPEDVVCVIDRQLAGGDLGGTLGGLGRSIPVVSEAIDAKSLGAEWLVIGVSTPGGYLPPHLKQVVYDAIKLRIGIISGLHESVNGDPNLVSMSARYAVELVNLRTIPNDFDPTVGTARARHTHAPRVLTVGTDANVGKTTTSLMLHHHLTTVEGLRSRFVATGQDGILITGKGLCIDRCIADFASGTVERLILAEDRDCDLLMVEGQNGLFSPCFSGTALSLLHGTCPDAMVLCHRVGRDSLRHTDVPMPSLTTQIQAIEAMLRPLHPGRVVAVGLNTNGLSEADARQALKDAAAETGLPTADVVRDGATGCAVLAKAIRKALGRKLRAARPARKTTKMPAKRATKARAH